MTTTTLIAHLHSPMDAGALMRALARLRDVNSVELVGSQAGTIRLAVEHDGTDPLDYTIRREPSLDWRINALDTVIQVWVR